MLFTATLSAISIATPNINTVIYTNFFKLLENFCHFLLFQTLMSEKLLWGLIIGYCIVSSGNEVVLKILTSIFKNFTIFFGFYQFGFSNFLTFIITIQVFRPQGQETLSRVCEQFTEIFFFGHGMVFNILIFYQFFNKVAIFFFKFLNFLFSGQGTSRVC